MATTSSTSTDATVYGREEIEPESQYAVFLRFPILYENATSDSDANGIGPLSDTISCQVVRTFNQFPTAQLTYKRNGALAKQLQEGRIIMTDMGPDLVHQKFRINQIQKSIDSIIVNATHIAGDIAYNTITQDLQIPNASATDCFNEIINHLADANPDIRFDTDVSKMSNVNMQMSSGNAGNLLIDADQEGDKATQSMAALFKGEWIFDNYHYYLKQNGGDNTGLVIKYGRDLKTIDQDTNIANTYTAIFPYATYTPAPPKATDINEDWNSIGSVGWINKATVTYAAGGAIDIYSSPVKGHRIVGHVTNGTHITLVKKITDGETLPDHNVVNTVNGDDWYYVDGQGWIDARWITFDKSGDYLVNDAVGHYTVDIGSGSARQTKYPFKGRGVVNYSGKEIHAYYSPFFGAKQPGGDPTKGHVRTGRVFPTGEYVNFSYKAINEKGDVWYLVAGTNNCWLYGPHISFKKAGTYIEDPTANGKAAVKSGAQKYVMKGGKIVKAPDKTKMVSTRTSKTKEYVNKTYTTYYHGKKIKQKHTVKNKAYTKKKPKKVKTSIKKGVYKIVSQVQYGGTTYYCTGNHTYIKSSDIDWKDRMSYKPKTIDEATKGLWVVGKIEMYSEPRFGTAMNWGIPNGESFATGATAHGDGEDWTQCTYHGKTGWVLSKYLKNKGDADFDSYNPKDLESSDDTQEDDTNVDVADLTVKLPELTLYADSAYGEEVQRVQSVDLTSYFEHDYQDESGLDQQTGKYQVTQADVDQLRRLAQAYMKEHRFGYPNVSLTLTAEEISDFQLDNIGLYDKVTVQFDQLGIYETAEVNSTTWDAMKHRYTSITIGELPIDYEHELLNEAKKNADLAVKKSSGELRGDTTSLIGKIQRIVTLQGTDQKQAWINLAEALGDAHKNADGTYDLDVSLKKFREHMKSMADNVTNFQDFIVNGGEHSTLHPVDANGRETWQNAVAIRAGGSQNSFELNSSGITYYDDQGYPHAAFGVDGSTGKLQGNFYVDSAHIGVLDASHIETDTIHSLGTIYGNLEVTASGITVHVGNFSNWLSGESDGGIQLTSANYESKVSSGSFNVHDKNSGSIGHYGPNEAVIGGKSVVVTSSDTTTLGSWIKRYWRGPSKYWNL